MHKTLDIGNSKPPDIFTVQQCFGPFFSPLSIIFVVFKASHSDGKRTKKFPQVAWVSLELGQPCFLLSRPYHSSLLWPLKLPIMMETGLKSVHILLLWNQGNHDCWVMDWGCANYNYSQVHDSCVVQLVQVRGRSKGNSVARIDFYLN